MEMILVTCSVVFGEEGMEKYDVCVIGGGPAGYATAMRAIDFGKRVVLIEANKVGGSGIYNGALSSKTLWELSEKVLKVNEALEGSGKKFEMTWKEVAKGKNEAIFERKFQYSTHLTLLQTESYNKLFTLERGFGSLLNNHEVLIKKSKCNEDGSREKVEKVIWADNIVLSTGSRPRKLNNIKVDEKHILTSDGIDHIDDFPKSLVIVGAGVIGCEYATIFSNFGKTKVHIIDRANKILPFEDDDISEMVAKNLRKKGVVIHQKAKLERMEVVDGRVEYELSYPDGRREVIHVEKALLSIGRVPNIENLGLHEAGIGMSKRGIHIGDDDTRTNVPNIYTVGDVSGRIELVNMAEIEGRHAIEKMYLSSARKLSYDNVCTIMFLHPEVAAVGLNEKQCIERNIPIKVVKIDYSCIPRAIAMRRTEGFFKIIVTNDDNMKILGMRAIGEHASSAIQAIALLIKMDQGIEVLAELVHPHPSIIEGIQECVRMLLNKSVFKSAIFKDRLKCYSRVENIKTPLQSL